MGMAGSLKICGTGKVIKLTCNRYDHLLQSQSSMIGLSIEISGLNWVENLMSISSRHL